jgi:hypothetical protein
MHLHKKLKGLLLTIDFSLYSPFTIHHSLYSPYSPFTLFTLFTLFTFFTIPYSPVIFADSLFPFYPFSPSPSPFSLPPPLFYFVSPFTSHLSSFHLSPLTFHLILPNSSYNPYFRFPGQWWLIEGDGRYPP